MQDNYPQVVTPDCLVNEILRDLPCEVSPSAKKAKSTASRRNEMCHTKLSSSSGTGGGLEITEGDEDIVLDTGSSISSSRSASIQEVDDGASTTNGITVSLAEHGYNEVVILDCQNPSGYLECHIRGAINVTFPAIIIRRIATGKIDLFEKSKELKAKVSNAKVVFVVYDTAKSRSLIIGGDNLLTTSSVPRTETNHELSDIVCVVSKKLAEKGCRVAILKDGLAAFKELYPEWIVTPRETRSPSYSDRSTAFKSEEKSVDEAPVLGFGNLSSLRIQNVPDISLIKLDHDYRRPVEIIQNLYLGNITVSADLPILERNNIKNILNVTPDLPNVFESGNIRYLRIPVLDHWTESIISCFPAAMQFIDEGRSKGEGVLVHCLAGISRSVTITVAYLMFKMGLSLNQAYDLVRSKKSNVSPNFHFMGQLLDFERQLTTCQFLSTTPALGLSPNSAAETLTAQSLSLSSQQ